jgi:hypothetical protein
LELRAEGDRPEVALVVELVDIQWGADGWWRPAARRSKRMSLSAGMFGRARLIAAPSQSTQPKGTCLWVPWRSSIVVLRHPGSGSEEKLRFSLDWDKAVLLLIP